MKVVGNNISSRSKRSKPAGLAKPEFGTLFPRILLCTSIFHLRFWCGLGFFSL